LPRWRSAEVLGNADRRREFDEYLRRLQRQPQQHQQPHYYQDYDDFYGDEGGGSGFPFYYDFPSSWMRDPFELFTVSGDHRHMHRRNAHIQLQLLLRSCI
jgi:hypothetical protein